MKELKEHLDAIEQTQKEISQCHTYYQKLEREIENRRQKNTNPEDYETLGRDMAVLSKEYEGKSDLLYENLNQSLLKGHDLAKKKGHQIGHDFQKLWDYMTNPVKEEVVLDRVLADIAYLKGLL